MKALVFETIGEPKDVLILKEIDKPTLGEGEALVKMCYSTINPADHLFMKGSYRIKAVLPQIAGFEGVGTVEACGEKVDLPIGTTVSFFYAKAWAEYVAVPKDQLHVLPKELPLEKAAQFTLNPMTAWGLLKTVNVKPDDWLLLTAGNSTVAKLIIQFAKQKNIRTIAAIRTLEFADELKNIGADAVVDVNTNDWVEQVKALTKGMGVNAVLDPVGGDIGTNALQCIALNGKHIVYGALSKDTVQFNNSLISYKNITIGGFGVRKFLADLGVDEKAEMIKSLTTIISQPAFKMEVAGIYDLKDFVKAFEAEKADNKKGKILLRI
ncbi:zinc-dependent alcohol dehydrogenase family protein [Chitinophagaceae bacterium LWZ2-11]